VARLRQAKIGDNWGSYYSLLYITTHDSDWVERNDSFQIGNVVTPQILNISFDYSLQENGKHCCNGPEDPRLYRDEKGHLCVSFNMQISLGGATQRRTHIHDLSTGLTRVVIFTQNPEHIHQKNWAPLVLRKQSYFLYDLNGTKFLECTGSNCGLIKEYASTIYLSSVRGGTPFVEVLPGVFLAFVFRHDPSGSYRPILVLLTVQNKRIESVQLRRMTGLLEFQHPNQTTVKVAIPASIPKFDLDNDWMELTLYFEDQFNFVFKVSGIKRFVEDALDQEKPFLGYSIDMLLPASFKTHKTSITANAIRLNTEKTEYKMCGPSIKYSDFNHLATGISARYVYKHWRLNPKNYLCHPNIFAKIRANGKSVVVKVTDLCHSCDYNQIAISNAAFRELKLTKENSTVEWNYVVT